MEGSPKNLEKDRPAKLQSPSPITNSQFLFSGGRKRSLHRRRSRSVTGTHGRGAFLKNWSKQQPGYHDRTVMLKHCGPKCFLGPNKTFPICRRNTCKVSKKGLYSAYIRAREYMTIKKMPKYRRISQKAHHLLSLLNPPRKI
jgi:hypothetical protein